MSPCAPARTKSTRLVTGLARDRVGAQAPQIVPAGDRSAKLPQLTSSAAGPELAQGGRLAGRDREARGGASGSARIKLQLRQERGSESCSAAHQFTAATRSHRVLGHMGRGSPAEVLIGKSSRAQRALCTEELPWRAQCACAPLRLSQAHLHTSGSFWSARPSHSRGVNYPSREGPWCTQVIAQASRARQV